MLKIFLFLASMLLLPLAAAGCQNQAPTAELSLGAAIFEAANWTSDGKQIETIKGKLSIGGSPVKGAVIAVGANKKTETDDSGVFEFTLDKSAIISKTVSVASVENATVEGKAPSEKEKANLLIEQKEVSVYYPITVISSQTDPKNANYVVVKAKAKAPTEKEFPNAARGGYALSGTVKTSDGKPAVGAIVSTVREDGEGFSQTLPTDENGAFLTKYIAESDNETKLRVSYSGKQYELPTNKYYYFPDNTSVKIDITLPDKGTTIIDKPPYLVSKKVPGAYYSSVIVGAEGQESGAAPDKNGEFQIKVKKEQWDKGISFREARWNGFSEKPITDGDALAWPQTSDYPKHIKAAK